MIVDITATQFGDYPEVMIVKPSTMGEDWRVGRAATTDGQIRNLLKGWAKEHQPYFPLTLGKKRV